MRTEHSTPFRRPVRGLSIAEVMISLAISSMLLVGVAAAYSASADSVEANDKFFRVTQAGRVTMTQLMTEIRRADQIVTAPTKDSVIITRQPDLRLNSEEQSREFKYDPIRKEITLTIYFKRPDNSPYTRGPYTLARNVEECAFGPPDVIGGVEMRIPVTVVIKSGVNSVRLSDTSGPRRVNAN